jgi:hypothetical protein
MKATRRGFFGMLAGLVAAAVLPFRVKPYSITRFKLDDPWYPSGTDGVRVTFSDNCFLKSVSPVQMEAYLQVPEIKDSLLAHGHEIHFDEVLRELRGMA